MMKALLICKDAEAENEAKKHFKLKEDVKCFFDVAEAMAWLLVEDPKPHFLVVDLKMVGDFIPRLGNISPQSSIIGMLSKTSEEQKLSKKGM